MRENRGCRQVRQYGGGESLLSCLSGRVTTGRCVRGGPVPGIEGSSLTPEAPVLSELGRARPTDLFPSKCALHLASDGHSTVTLLARFLGLSTSVPRAMAVWYASSCSGTTCSSGLSGP